MVLLALAALSHSRLSAINYVKGVRVLSYSLFLQVSIFDGLC